MRTIRIYVIIILTAVSRMLQAQEISIEDYRIPVVNYSTMQLTAAGALHTNEYNWGSGGGGYWNGDRIVNSSLFYRGYSYDEEHTLNILTSLNSEYKKDLFRDFQNDEMMQEHSSREIYRIDLQGEYHRYIVPNEYYLSAGASVNGDYSWYEEVKRSSESYQKNRGMNADLNIGAGIGKIREGSAVFTAVRVLEKLGERNLLRRELTQEEINAIVQIVAEKDRYESDQERFEKYFFGDIIKELESRDLLVSEQLDAFDILKVSEVLQETILPRFFGTSLEAGSRTFFHYSDNVYAAPRVNMYHRSVSEYKGFSHEMYLEGKYGTALSLNTHFYSVLSADFPGYYYQYTKLQLRSSSTLSHQLTDRFNGDVSLELNKWFDYLSGIKSTSFWATYGLHLRYFIENNIFFTLAGTYTHSATGYSSGALEFGLNYRFF